MTEPVSAGAAVAAAIIQGKMALWDPLKRTIESSNDMGKIHRALKDAMEKLEAIRKDHDYKVEEEKATKMPSNTYTNWKNRVGVVLKAAKELEGMHPKESKRSRFSISKRSKFTKNMKEKAIDVCNLMEEVTKFEVLVNKKRERVVEMTTPTITKIPTLQTPLDRTLGWLSDKKVTGISIYGLVGSGKTTIMQNLNNCLKDNPMFDIVIWVPVSREVSMENRAIDKIQQNRATDEIQQIIAQRLKLDIEVTTHHGLVASRIREELQSIKYLLLLDDVKKDLNLEEIGVPTSHNGSKIVFTTREQHVCPFIADRQINVATLKEEEAFLMFESVLDLPDHVKITNIKPLMRLIIKCCGYHPLMIKVAAGFFRVRENEELWHTGLEMFRNWPEKGDDNMQEIYKLLKRCVDCLKGTQKNCFLYSALYPEDSDIQKDCLLDNWAAAELLDAGDCEEELRWEKLRTNGRGVLNDLKMVSLLEENTFQQSIRMHKLIRMAALYNFSTNDDQGILVKSGETLHNTVDVESWKDKKWISLVDSKMNALPDQPDCSTLSTLILQKNKNLEVIPRAFFEHMQSLRVLDLYDTRIKSLPDSLLELATLKVLYLQKCVALVELHRKIGNLQKLEVLDIRGSGLENIPSQVERLISLRRLLVSFTSSKSNLTPTEKAKKEVEVISKIRTLKELVVDVEDGLERILYGEIVERVELKELYLLQFCFSDKVVDYVKAIWGRRMIYFPDERLLRNFIDRSYGTEFNKYQIFTGCDFSSDPDMEFMPYYKFYGEVSDATISKVLCNDAAIELVNHNGLEHLSSFTAENMNRIRSCVIKDCNKMQTIVDGNTGGGSILNNMEQLHMINLPVLKNICEGPMQGLKSLKTLILCNCPMLTWVCTYGVILQLPEIRHLEVERCPEIKEIFSGSTNIVSPILPNLKKLILVNMPQLRSILESNSFEWPSLERLKILGCPNLKRLPFQKDGAVKLTSIEAEKSWWEALENDQEVTDQFRRYCTLK